MESAWWDMTIMYVTIHKSMYSKQPCDKQLVHFVRENIVPRGNWAWRHETKAVCTDLKSHNNTNKQFYT